MIEEYIIPVIFLVILSIIDIKTFNLREGLIPSALTTIFLITSFFLGLNIITTVLSFLMGMLFVDVDLFGGIPDWKVLVACGMVLPTIQAVLLFGLLISVFGLIMKLIIKGFKINLVEIPFIPVIALSYLSTLGLVLL